MKKIVLVAAAAGLMTLAACTSPEAPEANVEDTMGNIEAMANDTMTEMGNEMDAMGNSVDNAVDAMGNAG
ncbi:hypothetical protein ACNI3Q_00855 [Sphingomonas sp. FW199]|uniref:hypothetical protein n=1 Tax=unclassified Sphingomonas TaxID=196159 RepID=UPI0021A3A855|nr:hypothetical protein [Sphingomonas sp. BGYR3]MDG5487651.1 hypothetical protein [Sphingomonas sp. BGYR3]